jgi:thioesterase domain-containing protein
VAHGATDRLRTSDCWAKRQCAVCGSRWERSRLVGFGAAVFINICNSIDIVHHQNAFLIISVALVVNAMENIIVPNNDCASTLISQLRAAGVTLWRADGDIRYSAPKGALTQQMLLTLAERKSDILPFLPHGPDPRVIYTSRTPNIVRIWDGRSGQIVFCIHAIDGAVASYFQIGRELASLGASTYGIAALDLHERRHIANSMESIVAEYVSQIRHIQPRGPYFLLGWSSGALIACEIAGALSSKHGEEAEATLLDPPLAITRETDLVDLPPGHQNLRLPHSQMRSAYLWWRFVRINAASPNKEGLLPISVDFWVMDDQAKAQYLYDNRHNREIIKADNGVGVARSAHDIRYMFDIVNLQFGALESHRPSFHPGSINLFITIDAEAPTKELGQDCLQLQRTVWRERAGKINHSEWVAGGHIAIIMPPNASKVARVVYRDELSSTTKRRD